MRTRCHTNLKIGLICWPVWKGRHKNEETNKKTKAKKNYFKLYPFEKSQRISSPSAPVKPAYTSLTFAWEEIWTLCAKKLERLPVLVISLQEKDCCFVLCNNHCMLLIIFLFYWSHPTKQIRTRTLFWQCLHV